MSKISAFYKKTGPVSTILSVTLSVLFVVTAVQAATTISTNISTDGTLSVTGASTLTGNITAAGTLGVTGLTSLGQASSTRLSVFDTAYFGGTATSTFNSAGALSVAGTLSVTGASTLTGASTHTGLASFGQASSTRFSVFDTAYFGGTATSTFSSAGALTLAGNLVLTTASSTGLATLDSVKISSTGSTITNHISATASLDFPVIGANSCQSLTITTTGAADGDTVSLGVPTALANASTTLALTGFVSAANTVTVRVCQVAASATSDPAAATVRADVWKH